MSLKRLHLAQLSRSLLALDSLIGRAFGILDILVRILDDERRLWRQLRVFSMWDTRLHVFVAFEFVDLAR